MKDIVQDQYGTADVLELRDVDPRHVLGLAGAVRSLSRGLHPLGDRKVPQAPRTAAAAAARDLTPSLTRALAT